MKTHRLKSCHFSSKMPVKRSARLEHLEARELLAVTFAEFDSICNQYPALGLSPLPANYNIVEINSNQLTSSNLRQAIQSAVDPELDNLLVLRTSSSNTNLHTLAINSGIDTITISMGAGSLTIVALGNISLTINANNTAPIMRIIAGNVQLANIQFSKGNGTSGGAINNAGDLLVTNCNFADNKASSQGGAIFSTGSLTLQSTQFSGNNAYSGGAIYTYDRLDMRGCTITGNQAHAGQGNGGAIYCESPTLGNDIITISQSTITLNTAKNGGGIYSNGANLSVKNSTIEGNGGDTTGYGGGIYCSGGLLTFNNSFIAGNVSSYGGGLYGDNSNISMISSSVSGNGSFYQGGGLLVNNGKLTMVNSIVTANSTGVLGGGGIYCDTDATLTNCTIAANISQGGKGGGLYNYGFLLLNNSIIAKNLIYFQIGGINTNGFGPDIWTYNLAETYVYTRVSYSLVGNSRYDDGKAIANISGGSSLIGTNAAPIDPLFIDPDNYDFHLRSNSPAYNRGSNTLAANAGVTSATGDFGGNPRIYNSTIEMGAFEIATGYSRPVAQFAASTYYIEEGGTVLLSAAGQSGSGLTYCWDVSGTGNFVAGNAQYLFSAANQQLRPGNFTIRLLVKDVYGVASAPVTANLIVRASDPKLTATVKTPGIDYVVQLQLEVLFPAGRAATKWVINWGDGQSTTIDCLSNLASAMHYYSPNAQQMYYPLSVQVTNSQGGVTAYLLGSHSVVARAMPADIPTIDAALTALLPDSDSLFDSDHALDILAENISESAVNIATTTATDVKSIPYEIYETRVSQEPRFVTPYHAKRFTFLISHQGTKMRRGEWIGEKHEQRRISE